MDVPSIGGSVSDRTFSCARDEKRAVTDRAYSPPLQSRRRVC